MCDNVKRSRNESAIVDAIIDKLEDLHQSTSNYRIRLSSVYFAAPQTLAAFIEKCKYLFEKRAMSNKYAKNVQFHTFESLINYANQRLVFLSI